MNLKNNLKPVPEFKSLTEEAEFWDSHDLTEYFDFSKAKWGKFVLEKPKTKDNSLTIRLQSDLKEKLDSLAQKLGLSASSLIRMWTIEKLSSV